MITLKYRRVRFQYLEQLTLSQLCITRSSYKTQTNDILASGVLDLYNVGLLTIYSKCTIIQYVLYMVNIWII